jgi:tetratricopeptide (TPR) repeat protein
VGDRPSKAATLQEICNQGRALHEQGRLEEARSLYKKVILRDPKHFGALYLLGLLCARTGQGELGVSLMKRAMAVRPGIAGTHGELGDVLRDMGRHEEAVANYDRAISLNPDYFDAHNNRGLSLQALGRWQEALASYEAAIRFRTDLAQPYYNRGVALQALGRIEEALASYSRTLLLDPRSFSAHYHRGELFAVLRRHDEALASFEDAIALKPDYVEAWANRAAALGHLRRYDEALTSAETAVALKPEHADAHYAAGVALFNLGRFEAALASYDRAIDLQPGHADALSNRGMLRLLLGRFEAGWRDYAWRKREPGPIADRLSDGSLWSGGEDPSGKRLFVYHEQGLGDTIQFLRYVKLLQDRGAEVALMAPPPLHPIARQMFPTLELLGPADAPGDFDYHCPLLSLPLAFGTTLESIPPPAPLLRAEGARLEAFRARLGAKARPRIGLAWSGNPDHRNDHERSIAFERLAPLLTDEAEWIALQTDIRAGDRAAFDRSGRVGFHGDALVDFADTAALLELMDLLITVDTSAAHLAGAMGKPVWVLLPFRPDWRWMLDRHDSPWHPSARLFRQPGPTDWESVIATVGAELAAIIDREKLS